MSSQVVLEVNNLSKHFERKIALSSLSFSINKGERVALIGPSGAGKTTLLNTFATLVQPDEGTVTITGIPASKRTNRKQLAKHVGIIRQQFDLVGPLPVIHNVLAGRFANGVFSSPYSHSFFHRRKEAAYHALDRVGLADKLSEQTANLSGGEQQRVALARLLLQKPEIILADEPVASLDPTRAEDILSILTQLVKEENQTLITSLHSVEYARKYFTRMIAIKEGKVFFDLPVNKVTDSLLSELYQLEEPSDNDQS